MRYVYIINPAAGKGKGPDILIPKIKSFFKNAEQYKIYVTEKAGQATEIARNEAESNEKPRIFACGGEGTFFEVLNGVAHFKNVELGVIPCGSANDFLKVFGEKELFFDIGEMAEGEALDIDLIKADDMYCINQCTVGMDALVADGMQRFKRWPLVSGKMAYNLAIVKVFFGKIGLNLNIKINDTVEMNKSCLFAVCANGPVYGGGYTSAPHATPYDGELDFTVIDTINKLKILLFLNSYSAGTHEKLACCTMGKCQSMEISADKPFPVNLDGEILHKTKVRFEIVKRAVKFIVPQKVANKLLINK